MKSKIKIDKIYAEFVDVSTKEEQCDIIIWWCVEYTVKLINVYNVHYNNLKGKLYFDRDFHINNIDLIKENIIQELLNLDFEN